MIVAPTPASANWSAKNEPRTLGSPPDGAQRDVAAGVFGLKPGVGDELNRLVAELTNLGQRLLGERARLRCRRPARLRRRPGRRCCPSRRRAGRGRRAAARRGRRRHAAADPPRGSSGADPPPAASSRCRRRRSATPASAADRATTFPVRRGTPRRESCSDRASRSRTGSRRTRSSARGRRRGRESARRRRTRRATSDDRSAAGRSRCFGLRLGEVHGIGDHRGVRQVIAVADEELDERRLIALRQTVAPQPALLEMRRLHFERLPDETSGREAHPRVRRLRRRMRAAVHPDRAVSFERLVVPVNGDEPLRVRIALFPGARVADRPNGVRRDVAVALMMAERDA